ncbi:phosphosulfolactate synthase [Desmospora activa]|uniref:Phosphosulfolactate synthase n=1 Tax=Desmospora activa DSM 45169 TaxID=1121389 RepID=A0A2T4Z9E5_9BACL|nr:phosphosulfolactate synthase [Desmospora activa]PTM58514.1 phosphosulfolactate synthase [Desmospora activa DSM 45169]
MDSSSLFWSEELKDPTRQRTEKPRSCGLTMVIDKGLGLGVFQDLLLLAGAYIDFIKLGFGTIALTPIPVLTEKLRLAQESDIHLYPGGTFFEVAYQQQGTIKPYLEILDSIGFKWIEISDGTIPLTEEQRIQAIQTARNDGFRVITEIGKKEKGSITPIKQLIEGFYRDRKAGAEYVIIEGRESGKNVGIFDADGKLDSQYLLNVWEEIDHSSIIWECPQHSQQVQLLQLLGPSTNLGNIATTDVLSVESLRRGLRADTFFSFLPSPLPGGNPS